MMEWILQIDTQIFYWINHSWQNPFFNWFMPFITEEEHWFPFILVLLVWLVWKGGTKGRIAAALIIPVIALSDQITSGLMKPIFDRPRPCADLELVNMLVGLKTSNSFPSSHASNSIAAAAFFSHYYPRHRIIYFILAILVSLSRVYIGVHYPSDILVGAFVGLFCAYFVIHSFNIIAGLVKRKKQ